MIAHRLYVGTIGEGLFRSLDGGANFRRACEGMFVECHVRALAVHPHQPATLYLGSELGLFVSTNGADSWTKLPAPLDGLQVWSLWIAPRRPEVLIAGTCPSRLFHSEDGGHTWSEAAARLERECPRLFWTRVTCILGDPDDPDHLWAGVEIDGVHHSRDGGRIWQAIGSGLSSRDIHALVLVPAQGGRPRRLLAATNNDLNVSEDDGATWLPLHIGEAMPWSYCRTLIQPCGRPEEILLGNGDAPPGSAGVIGLSRDGGRTWTLADMPSRANSTLWNFAVHPADSRLIYASSVSGQLYRSLDGGASWQRLPREFGEVRALAWAPLEG
ncbi:MAG: WD40/YVTN/BNR-like repeat-containing protein [Gemmataceae bacterium]